MAGPKKAAKKAAKAETAETGTALVPVSDSPLVTDPEAAALFGPRDKKKLEAFEEFNRKAEIAQLTAAVNKQFNGKAMVRSGSEITNVFMLRRPTGVTTLDLACGGGFPAGGLTQIIGKFSAGKTFLANKSIATAQETYGEEFAASACMTEQRYDKNFAKWKCGLRIAFSDQEIALLRRINYEYGRPDYTPEQIAWLKDQVGIFQECIAANAEEILEIACQQVESNLFQIILIDSFGALLTAAEAEAEEGLTQKYRGGAAMVVTQFMHRLHAALNLPDKYGRPNTTTVIGINQYRDNVGGDARWNPMKVAGGHALAHGKLLDVHIEAGAAIRHESGNGDKIKVGKEIHWEIMKGKAGCHDGPKGTYKFYYGENGYGFGIDVYSDLLVAGLQAEVVEQSGAWYSFNGERIGQGAANAAIFLHQHPDVLQAIRRGIFMKAGLNFIIKENV